MNMHPTQSTNIKRYALILAIVWTTIIIALMTSALYHNYQSTIEAARIEARATFDKDLLYRRWVTMHGGVYVPATDQTPPNPYLSVPRRDVETTDGLELTLVNPAYMTRQVHKLGQQLYGTQGHITSLNPIRPANAPDAWETEALLAFEQGEKEVTSIETINGDPVLRYMRAMMTEEDCLACHAEQGYELGDIRGGISVMVPMNTFMEAGRPMQRGIVLGYGFLWIIGLGGITLSGRHLLQSARREEVIHQSLKNSEQRLKMTLEGTRAGTWEWHVQTGDTVFNERWAEIIGYTLDELKPIAINTWLAFAHPDDLLQSEERLKKHFSGETPYYECEVRMRHKHGHWVWVLDRGAVMEWDEDGKPLRMFGTHIDITERKQAEAALRESEERFRAFVTQSNDGIVLIDEDTHILEWNPAQERITGINRDKAMHQSIVTVQSWNQPNSTVDETQYKQLEQEVRQALRGENVRWLSKPIETPIRHQDGSQRVVQSVIFPIRVGTRQILGSIVRDITDQQKTEAALRESEERYRSVINAMSEGVVLQMQDGTIQACNPAAERILGLTVDQMMGRTSVDTRWNATHEDGSPFPGETHPAMVTLRTGEPQSNIVMGIQKPDQERTWIAINSQPICYRASPDDNIPDAVVTTFADITEQRQARQRKFELALEKERRHLLTAFIQNAAHEFRTPLSSINANAYLLARLDDAGRRETKAEQTKTQVHRITKLVDTLLLMARLESSASLAHTLVDVPKTIELICQEIMSRDNAPDIHCHIPPDLPPIMGDMDYLVDAIKQLLDNACRFTPPGGTITLTGGKAENGIWLEVRDTGPGITEEALPHIFNSFWRQDVAHTTPGFGLGLPIAQKIIDRHGGCITVSSEVGQGTAFTVQLPCKPPQEQHEHIKAGSNTQKQALS